MRRRLATLARVAGLITALLLGGCYSEALEKQAQQLKEQEARIAAQRQEIEALRAGQKLQDEKQRNCNRAFREYFEKAQAAADREKSIALYRDGLALCPDDDIAHYELGKTLAAAGRREEARSEFQAALKINPNFSEAKRQLDALGTNR